MITGISENMPTTMSIRQYLILGIPKNMLPTMSIADGIDI